LCLPAYFLHIALLGIDRKIIAVTISQGYLVDYQLPIDKIKKGVYIQNINRPEPVVMAFGCSFVLFEL